MGKGKREGSPLYLGISFGFTSHPITVWAGVILMRLYFEWIKLREELDQALVKFVKRSNNQIAPAEVMLGWFYWLTLGAGGRADSENRIKELNEDLSLDTFCLKSFEATDAAFRMGGVLYNLLAEFRETVLPRAWFEKRLRAVRDFVFLVGADLISQGRRVRIRFALAAADRAEFLRRLRTLSEGLPIAAQLEWSESDQQPTHPDQPVSSLPLLTPFSAVNQSP